MPHSSGGGSHSGGSHGGHSSSRGGSSSSSRVSNTYFPGARRYMYYDDNHEVHFQYSNYDLSGPSKLRFLLLIIYLPFIFAIISGFANCVFIPRRLNNPNNEIVIDDRIGIIQDEEKLKETLYDFYEKTGVTPAVRTIYNEDWAGYYNTLEDYAYKAYVEQFTDEMHWVIVYSQPRDMNSEFPDWYWEGMIGDDTGKSISDELCEEFTDIMHANLYRYHVETAIATSFNEILSSRKFSVSLSSLGMYLFMALFIGVHMFFMVFADKKEYHKGAVVVEETVEKIRCAYCGGTYASTENSCPHCAGIN